MKNLIIALTILSSTAASANSTVRVGGLDSQRQDFSSQRNELSLDIDQLRGETDKLSIGGNGSGGLADSVQVNGLHETNTQGKTIQLNNGYSITSDAAKNGSLIRAALAEKNKQVYYVGHDQNAVKFGSTTDGKTVEKNVVELTELKSDVRSALERSAQSKQWEKVQQQSSQY